LSGPPHEARLELKVAEKARLALFKALKPEVESKAPGCDVAMTFNGEKLIITFNARSLSRLRAVLNSYLRWIKSICEAIDVT